jgi:hypothetical protein
MDKVSPKLWLLLVTLFALALTTFTLSHIVTAPWHEIPELGADGGKNIYTYLYQVLYGRGLWFQGMNYPYGEHIVYTDGQPLLSVPLSYLQHRVSIGTALTIMWWLVAISYVLSIIYCFKILVKFKVAPLIAMCFAGLITVFTPQLFRISGHYALSVACILPMLFYWSLQYYNSGSFKYPVFIFIMGALATFLHPYYAAVSLVWAGCYAAGYLLTRSGAFAAKMKHIVPMLVSVLAVFALFGIFMKVTDTATDRPATPFGILANCSSIKDIISNVNSPVWAFIKHITRVDKINEGGEGRAYVGLTVIIAVVASAFIWLRNKRRGQKLGAVVSEGGFQPIWLFMALVALLFAMGAPFTWHMEWLLDYAAALKQFRTLGRFSWISYYIITIYGSVVIYNAYAALMAGNRKIAANALLFAALGLWGFEASGYVARTHKKLDIGYHAYDTFVSTGQTNWEQFLNGHKYKKEDFQATLVLPFFEVGSEKLWVGNDENISAWAIAMGIQAGIQLHLPMIDGMMSRTSWDVAFKQVKIVGGPYVEKPILRDVKSNKPFLMIKLNMAGLNPDEAYLIEASDSIGEYQNSTIYACYPGRLRDLFSNIIKDLTTPAAPGPNSMYCTYYWAPCYTKLIHFDSTWENTNALTAEGGIPYSNAQVPVIANIEVAPRNAGELYEFSCWFRVSSNDYKSPVVLVEALDSSGHILLSKRAFAKESTDNYKLWVRTALYFNMPGNTNFVRCTIEDVKGHSYEAMAELMVRPANDVFISHSTDSCFMINNHFVKTKQH